MPFRINVSDKGKTLNLETEAESLIRSKIGEVVKGESFSPDLEGYELEITGTSDIAGFPGIKGQPGPQLRRILLTQNDKGMRLTKPKGLRLKKSVRGEEISDKTIQINMKVIKHGSKKFADLLPKKEAKVEEAKPGEVKQTEAVPAQVAKAV